MSVLQFAHRICSLCIVFAFCAWINVAWSQDEPTQAKQQDDAKDITFQVADGGISLTAPGAWEQVDPAVRMIEAEFSIPAVEGDDTPGRLTIMGAGGTVSANIDRWIAQVEQPDGSSTAEAASVTEREVNGARVHILDVAGTYLDQRGPAAPKVSRENYRLIGVIIETPSSGNYFIKFYGPAKTVEEHHDHLMKMVDSLEFNDD